ncbi:MAG: hypothetical protein ACJ72D_08190, partial [Marmoricola sp.]
ASNSWSASLPAPLFDPAERWVPGDIRTATFWVRNQASDAGTLTLQATVHDLDGLIARDDVSLMIRRDGGAWVPLPPDVVSRPFGDRTLPAAASTRIDLRAELVAPSPNRSQVSTVLFDLAVGLSETSSVSGPSGGATDHPGLLPDTGGVPLGILLAGAVLLALGLLILIPLRRRAPRKDRDD